MGNMGPGPLTSLSVVAVNSGTEPSTIMEILCWVDAVPLGAKVTDMLAVIFSGEVPVGTMLENDQVDQLPDEAGVALAKLPLVPRRTPTEVIVTPVPFVVLPVTVKRVPGLSAELSAGEVMLKVNSGGGGGSSLPPVPSPGSIMAVGSAMARSEVSGILRLLRLAALVVSDRFDPMSFWLILSTPCIWDMWLVLLLRSVLVNRILRD